LSGAAQNGLIRRMTESDLERVLDIEKLSFRSPWSPQGFIAELEKPYGQPLVFVDDQEISGYIIVWRVSDELHVANLAVHPGKRRRHIAENLLRYVLETETGVSWIGLEVRASNAPARALYRKYGFIETGVRKGYYADEKEDAILMARSVQSE
jgi:ribosomal-protein-alanine N-acetyltransferase